MPIGRRWLPRRGVRSLEVFVVRSRSRHVAVVFMLRWLRRFRVDSGIAGISATFCFERRSCLVAVPFKGCWADRGNLSARRLPFDLLRRPHGCTHGAPGFHWFRRRNLSSPCMQGDHRTRNCSEPEPGCWGSGFSRSPQHNPFRSECVEKRHQSRVFLLGAFRSGFRRIAQRHRPGLHPEINLGVDVGGLKAYMAGPCPDRVDVDPGLKQVAGARMAKLMRCHGVGFAYSNIGESMI